MPLDTIASNVKAIIVTFLKVFNYSFGKMVPLFGEDDDDDVNYVLPEGVCLSV